MANFPTSAPNLKTNYVDNVDDVMAANQNTPNDEVNAIASKIGTGASTPTSGKVLKGTGTGTSSWEEDGGSGAVNILSNGNFINNSTNGYGGTSDDWTNSSANPVQGGIPALTKQNLIDWLGVSDGDIEALYNLNGNLNDLSSNGYNLTAGGGAAAPTDSSDGLMAQAKDFESGSSQYASAAAANANITGAQTFICYFKPESLVQGALIGFAQNAVGQRHLRTETEGTISFQMTGLSTTNQSDVKLSTGKWYMIVGIFNGTDTLTLWVNGIKKTVAVTGSVSALTSNLGIGRREGYNDLYQDGLIQNAGVLSVALTDAQVERLWWETLGKKTKLRRATSDGYIYQSLPQNLVEQYKGKTLSVTAKVYQDTASIAQVSLYDGAETASSTSTTTGSWIDIGATRTISATARQIDVRAKVSSSDGNAWFKEIQVYEGSSLVYEWSPENPAKNEIGGVKSTINISPLYAPEGFLINGKIVPSVASNNLTVAIKTMAGADPSASSPVYVRIGDTIRSITGALSTPSLNAGSNWMNAGSAELATKEIDYFVYLIWDTVATTIKIALSRIPYGNVIGDFNVDGTNEKGIPGHANFTVTDTVVNIGRFSATLSAGAGYTWTVPTFTASNLIQRPIYETRWLSLTAPPFGASGSLGSYAEDNILQKYKIIGDTCFYLNKRRVTNKGSWSGEVKMAVPFTGSMAFVFFQGNIYAQGGFTLRAVVSSLSTYVAFQSNIASASFQWTSVSNNDWFTVKSEYQIS